MPIEIKTIITEDFTGLVRFEMISPPADNATEKEKRIAARVRDSFDKILDDIADLAINETTEPSKPALPPPDKVIDV